MLLAQEVLTPALQTRIERRVEELIEELGADGAITHIMDALRVQKWDTREDLICSYGLFIARARRAGDLF